MTDKQETLEHIKEGSRIIDNVISDICNAETHMYWIYKDLFKKYVKGYERIADINYNHVNNRYDQQIVIFVQGEKLKVGYALEKHVLDTWKVNFQLEHQDELTLDFMLENCKYEEDNND